MYITSIQRVKKTGGIKNMKKQLLSKVLLIALVAVLMFTFSNAKAYDVAGEEDIDINPLSTPYDVAGEEDIDINPLSLPHERLV